MDKPIRLSVIMVSFSQPAILYQTITALYAQISSPDHELMVVRQGEPPTFLDEFPAIQWITPPTDANVPKMRSLAVQKAQGQIIALLEDDCVVNPTWVQAVLDLHQSSDAVGIGGPIAPDAYERGLDLGVFVCEFGRFMMPVEPKAKVLPGNNASYKAAPLRAWVASAAEGLVEVFMQAAWIGQGLRLQMEPALQVTQIQRWGLEHTTRIPYHHGRTFVAQRLHKAPIWKRLVYFVASPALLFRVFLRIIFNVKIKKIGFQQVLPAWPWIILFCVSWIWGEAVGSILGVGSSASQWR